MATTVDTGNSETSRNSPIAIPISSPMSAAAEIAPLESVPHSDSLISDVIFTIRAQLAECQSLKIVGSCPALGSWDISAALRLEEIPAITNTADDERQYMVAVSLPRAMSFEYRYFLADATDQMVVTERKKRVLATRDDITMTVDDGAFLSTAGSIAIRDPGFLHKQTQLRVWLGHPSGPRGARTMAVTGLSVPAVEYYLELAAEVGVPVWFKFVHASGERMSQLLEASQIAPEPVPIHPNVPEDVPFNLFPSLFHARTCDDLFLSATVWVPDESGDAASTAPGLPALRVLGRAILTAPDFLGQSGIRTLSRTLLDSDLKAVGRLDLAFLVVWPFSHPENTIAGAEGQHDKLISKPMIGHRGLGSNKVHGGHRVRVSENTALSFQLAAQRGVRFIEFDAQMTKDDKVVIHHNFEFEAGTKTDGSPLIMPIRLVTAKEFLATAPSRAAAKPRSGMTSRRTSIDLRHAVSPELGHAPFDTPAPSQTVAALVSNRPPLYAQPEPGNYRVIFEQRASLKQMFRELPVNLGFNIEVKYPSKHAMGGLVRYPSRPHVVDCILQVVFDEIKSQPNRPVFFSSFDPEIITLLRLKQARFPVFFLNAGFINEHEHKVEIDAEDTNFEDAVCSNPFHGVLFAARMHLTGVVLDVETALLHEGLVSMAHDLNLLVYTYGTRTDDEPLHEHQWKILGIDGMIADNLTRSSDK
ncbi:Glycerophosphoryl diester phosphodiesterase family [Carpediemonas membranifera]|uniref:Glycerophosphoryl diester phosphodiesterase family n=1 Tax=Carpediemonas membranifera TaxID=201153 RepID=A0A8J6B1G8_9EUKA|nr:Glycerophosphoryl diester phosphodiesterase family [Carpediemonas membranifera]|eukprot:KAG9391007.1 Glycerophosphoryl diester phosphodiesterase family [Carpediemonas membranifera]